MLFLSISLFSPIFPSRFPSSELDTLIFGIAFWVASKHLLDFSDFIPSLLFRFINLRLKNDISLLVPTVEHQFLALADQLIKSCFLSLEYLLSPSGFASALKSGKIHVFHFLYYVLYYEFACFTSTSPSE